MRPWSIVVPVFLAGVLLSQAGCSSFMGPRREADADLAFRMGYYAQAHRLYLDLLERSPGNSELQRKERIARMGMWLAQGRDAVFQEQLSEAEAIFRRVLGEMPGHAGARAWLQKVHAKQADLLVLEAILETSKQDFQKARRLVSQAQALWPRHPGAKRLEQELLERIERERRLGRFLLAEGLRILQDSVESTHLPVVRHYLQGARALMSGEFTHDWVLDEVERRLGEQHLAQVREMLGRDENASALVEASLASSLLPELPGLDELKALAQREIDADALAEEARQFILRGNPKAGEEKLARAAQTSAGRRGLFKAAQVEVEEARLKRDYEEALGLEAQGRFHEALAAFREIALQDPYFRDAEARAEGLEAALAEADRILGEVRVLAAKDEAAQALRRLKDLFMLFPWHREGLLLQRKLMQASGEAESEERDEARP